MPQNPISVDPILLAEQRSWVLSLARSLVRDPTGADDVAQETLLAGLVAAPHDASDPRRLRAWLGRVVFNLAHLSTRRSLRRRAREEEVARPERQRSAADTAIRESVMRHVGRAVAELKEPYRSVVIMRYFEGLSTTAIAAASQSSESAVRKRLWRARGQLRQELEAQHNGERQAWFQGALPLLGWRFGERSRELPGLLRMGSAALGAVLLLVAAGVLLVPTHQDQKHALSAAAEGELHSMGSPELLAPKALLHPVFLGYLRTDPVPQEEQNE